MKFNELLENKLIGMEREAREMKSDVVNAWNNIEPEKRKHIKQGLAGLGVFTLCHSYVAAFGLGYACRKALDLYRSYKDKPETQ